MVFNEKSDQRIDLVCDNFSFKAILFTFLKKREKIIHREVFLLRMGDSVSWYTILYKVFSGGNRQSEKADRRFIANEGEEKDEKGV